MDRIVGAATAAGDVVWEPFGGLVSASVAALWAGRFPCAAESNPGNAALATQRLGVAAAAGP